jgi:uncharacterized membrane protein YbhN (UPF0104 family)
MTTTVRSRRRGLLVTLIKLSVSLGLIGVLFSRIDAARLWHTARGASPSWLLTAIALYFAMLLASAWRWGLLLRAQGVALRLSTLMGSFLVATFFNNFLPSNIGGDVVRVADTAPAAGSKTLAATVVLIDRGIGLLGLLLIAALGATAGPRLIEQGPGLGTATLWTAFAGGATLVTLAVLVPRGLPRLLRPLRLAHPEWVDVRLDRLATAFERFRQAPLSLVMCFAGAVVVQIALVAFYAAIARSMHIPVGIGSLAFIVPVTFIIQMAPVSMNGFGVREATFGFYFMRLGLPLEAALVVSFVGAALMMVVSLAGGATYLVRGRIPSAEQPEETVGLLDRAEGQPYS